MQKVPLAQQLTYEQVALVVHHFYKVVVEEPLLSPFFYQIENWPEHERHITDFWWGVMGGKVEEPRPDAMRQGHAELRFGEAEINCWLSHFRTTLEHDLSPELAAQWAAMADQLGSTLLEHHSRSGR